MKVAAIGDNCIDVYLDDDGEVRKQYPTGNVVDTGVNLQKLGISTSIISTTGDDAQGKWMIQSLEKEGVDLSHFKQVHGATAVTQMQLNGNDRVHGEYFEGVLGNMVFDEDDINFAAKHTLVHSAFWGKADSVLPEIKRVGNPLISFDYADKLRDPLIAQTLPFVDIGFFSYHGERDEVIEKFLKDKVDQTDGLKVGVATFGNKGSLAYDGERFYQFGIVSVEKIVNTVGAGDSFISGFLQKYLEHAPIEDCLEQGATVSSTVIQVFEPWTK